MNIGALNLKMLRDLWDNIGQAFAIALVIAASVATAVLSSGTYRSLEITRNAYYTNNHFADVFASLKRAPDHLKNTIEHIPGVMRADTRIWQYTLFDMPHLAEPVRGLVISLPKNFNSALNIPHLRAGHWPHDRPDQELVIDEAFAKAHKLHVGDKLKATIHGKQKTFIVSGIALSPEFIYALGPGDLVPDSLRYGVFWMDREALAAAGNLKGAFNNVTLQIDPAVNPHDIITNLDTLLTHYGGTGAYLRKDQLSNAFVTSELDQLKTMTNIVPPIFLIAAVFLLNIAITRLIDTERQQIGLLKAIGYSDFSVGWHYLKSALIISGGGILIGCILGIWMGSGMISLYGEYFRFPVLYYQVTPDVILGVTFISLMAAGLGALFSIRKAVTLPPAVAMLPPPPPLYRPLWWEKIKFMRRLSTSEQMIIRHLARWPLRSGLTVIGTSLAVALLLFTLYFFDSVEVMLNTYFFQTNRQDITVSFVEPRNDAVKSDLLHLPGVMRAELERNVQAEIRFQSRSKRISIQGVHPSARLTQHKDIGGNLLHVPDQGIVINDRLAEILGTKIGDKIYVRILEGRQPEEPVLITGIAHEYVGTAAYMNKKALNRLLLEAPVTNTALLSIDHNKITSFYRAIKQAPAVLGIASKEAAANKFRQLIKENILVMVGFYITFAAVLAFGVIYNHVRLTLAEREREFSLLRVLGFHEGEVAAILAGEVALLTLVSLLPGCFAGYGLIALLVAFFSTDLYRLPFVVEPATYGYAVLAMITAAIISGIIAAWRLKNLDLLGALKSRE